MQKMYRRLGKYALDPDNKTEYLNRADRWAEYTEKWQNYHEEQLANAVKSGIIELNRKRNPHRHTGAVGQRIIDKATYNKLTKKFKRNGGLIIRGEKAKAHLSKTGSRASYLPSLNTAFIQDDATVSDVLEEMYHAEQDRRHLFGEKVTDIVLLRREIDAQKYLLSLTDKYKIPFEEVELTKINLANYERDLLNYIIKKG